MTQTLEIPSLASNGLNLDAILAQMQRRESSGNPIAQGKKGEVGLFQIMPQTAREYGVPPELLTNPGINRYVAKRYLSDLIKEFKGNIPLAVAAYNAGPGRVRSGNIPASTRKYVSDVLGGAGGGLDAVASPPATTALPSAQPNIVTQQDMTPPSPAKAGVPFSLSGLFGLGMGSAEAGTMPIPSGATIGKPASKTVSIPKGAAAMPIPPGATLTPGTLIPSGITPPTPPKGPPVPFPVKAAGYLPVVGQMGGEIGGGALGAAIPGAGETGIPEFLLASGGGGMGAAGGAEIENWIRKQYGLPPVSVAEQGLIGGAFSAGGGLLPFVARFRKAAALAKSTGLNFRAAFERVTQSEAELEGKLGVGPRKAKLLENAPATQAQQGYRAAKNIGLKELGTEYDSLLKKFYHRMTPNSVKQLFDNSVGRMLELAGKPLRQVVQEELDAQPMTVRRAQQILSELRRIKRGLNPDTMRAADIALGQLEKAVQSDIRAVTGPTVGKSLDALDYYYARQMSRFPEAGAFRKAHTEPAAAEAILKSKTGDSGRVVEVVQEMKRTGQIDSLRRATAVRIFQKAAVNAAENPAKRFKSLIEAIESVKPEVFDELYGKGAQKEWLDTARDLNARHKELLANPNEAAAITAEVRKYLNSPGMAANLGRYLGHRAVFDALLIGGGYEMGSLATGIGAVIGVEGYEMLAHSRPALKLLEKVATEKNPQRAARFLIAAFNAAIHGAAQSTLGESESMPTAAPGGP